MAALSLGIDLGFGQPMEHVLLINVGCHSDAHEQAKWFGDDIALKSTGPNSPPPVALSLETFGISAPSSDMAQTLGAARGQVMRRLTHLGEHGRLADQPEEEHDARDVYRPPPQARSVGAVPPLLGSRRLKASGLPARLPRAQHPRRGRGHPFGLFDKSEDDYHQWRGEADAEENQRVDRLSAFVHNEYVSGVYEVVDVVDD